MSQTTAEWNAHELHQQLVSRAYRILRSREAAEDVVQDAYVRCLAHKVDEIRNPMAWLNVAVRNIAYDHLRRLDTVRRHQEREGLKSFAEEQATAESPCDVLARRKACRAMIHRLLSASSSRDSASVLLREVFDVSYRDIAQASGRTETSCRQAVRRSLRRAYASDAPLKVAVIQADPLLDARVGLFEQAVHDGRAEPLLEHLRVSASASGQGECCLKQSYWLPFNEAGQLVFHLFLGPIGLCSSSVVPVLHATTDV